VPLSHVIPRGHSWPWFLFRMMHQHNPNLSMGHWYARRRQGSAGCPAELLSRSSRVQKTERDCGDRGDCDFVPITYSSSTSADSPIRTSTADWSCLVGMATVMSRTTDDDYHRNGGYHYRSC
jgi:hypothetical protein